MQSYVNPSERNGCVDNWKEVGVSWAVELLRCLNAYARKVWGQLVCSCSYQRQVEQGKMGQRWKGQASGAKPYHLLSDGPFLHQLKPKDNYCISAGHPCICRMNS